MALTGKRSLNADSAGPRKRPKFDKNTSKKPFSGNPFKGPGKNL